MAYYLKICDGFFISRITTVTNRVADKSLTANKLSLLVVQNIAPRRGLIY